MAVRSGEGCTFGLVETMEVWLIMEVRTGAENGRRVGIHIGMLLMVLKLLREDGERHNCALE